LGEEALFETGELAEHFSSLYVRGLIRGKNRDLGDLSAGTRKAGLFFSLLKPYRYFRCSLFRQIVLFF
jgi:hypothetical protein